MTAKQMSVAVGANILYRVGELKFACIVRDAKCSYGTARVEIAPVNGAGSMWVNLSSVEVSK